MATSQTEVESQVIELAAEAFKAFCDDVGGMFGVGMRCEQKEVRAETVTGLKKCFKKLVAVNVVDATGALEGTFQLIFDQEGLFTLGGVIVMLPEQRILANRKDPSPELAASMVDAVGEAGNLLVGSWDRVFREGLKGHGHFLQRLPAFVGKPWDEPQGKIGLLADGELTYVPYEMTIGSYPSFNCGVIFPKTLFESTIENRQSKIANRKSPRPAGTASDGPASEDGVAAAISSGTADAEVPRDTETEPELTNPKESNLSDKSDAPHDNDSAEPQQQLPVTEETRAGEEAAAKEDTPETQAPASASPDGSRGVSHPLREGGREDAAQDNAEAKPSRAPQEEPKKKSKPRRRTPKKTPAKETDAQVHADSRQIAEAQTRADQVPKLARLAKDDAPPSQEHTEPAAGKVSQAIRKMTQSYGAAREGAPAVVGEPTGPIISESAAHHTCGRFLSTCAKDIMQGRVIWASPDETVQQVLAKMQQHDTGYVMVGADGALEGIVSRSDVTGALSPYLRSLFAKWRRPLDDATLKIKIKWIMSRPVRTIKPQTPLVIIMENMCRFGGSALPVVNKQGKVQGLVTVFDIFRMLLNNCAEVPAMGRAPQSPPLT